MSAQSIVERLAAGGATLAPRRRAALAWAGLARLTAGRLAGLALLFNLPFAVFSFHRLAFDSYVHIFLADHYRLRWWSLWEPRWYLGFSVASYPPLVHQLIALLSWPIHAVITLFSPFAEPYPGAYRWTSEEAAYLAVLLGTLAAFPVALRAFARVFVGPRAASLAGLFAVGLPALALAAWTFGQLPTLFATTAALLALARGHAFARAGRTAHLAQAVLLAAVAGAAHHAVFLFVPLAGLAVAWRALAQARRGQARPVFARLALWAALSGLAVAAAIWPFLAWSRGQDLQTPIDHASRHNLLADYRAALFFLWPAYGPLFLLLPAAVALGLRVRRGRLWPLLALLALLFVLGLGGTTPLPRWLYGAGWAWLTYDRFSLWAAMLLLPFAAAACLRSRRPRAALAWLGLLLAGATLAGSLAVITRSQPPAVNVAPLVQFLSDPARRPFRYITLGLGDQFARLSALAPNGSLDGNYHTARRLAELRRSGLGALDTAVWSAQGAAAVQPFLQSAERYGLRWALVNHPAYRPYLLAAGWRFYTRVGEVEAWRNAAVTRPVVAAGRASAGGLAAVWWGTAPLAVLALAVAAGLAPALRQPAWRARLSRPALARAARRVRLGLWAATLALCTLWWVHVAQSTSAPYVYFVYRSVLLFAADVAAAATLCAWLLERALNGAPWRLGPIGIAGSGLALIGASALSVLASPEPALSRAATLHWLLLGAWYWMSLSDPPAPRRAGQVFGALLLIQSGLALVQVVTQTTGGLEKLWLPWPGDLEPAMPGASVVQNAAGERWLRAYGTLPHPNILAGVLVILLAGAAERFGATGRRRWLALAALGSSALVLTFSRASWLGGGVMLVAGLWGAWRRGMVLRARAVTLAAVVAGAAALTLLPLLPFLLARVHAAGETVVLEQRSLSYRAALTSSAFALLRDHPWRGVGVGAFVTELARAAPEGVPREPAHNVLLMAAVETGLPGALALLGLWAAAAWRAWQRRRHAGWAETVLGAALLGALVAGLFDHFWWTMPPARLLWVTALGTWAGWGEAATPPSVAAPAGSAPPAR